MYQKKQTFKLYVRAYAPNGRRLKRKRYNKVFYKSGCKVTKKRRVRRGVKYISYKCRMCRKVRGRKRCARKVTLKYTAQCKKLRCVVMKGWKWTAKRIKKQSPNETVTLKTIIVPIKSNGMQLHGLV